MKGKRLFWASIIVVELVVIYLLWRPRQAQFAQSSHKTTAARSAMLPPEKESASGPAAEAAEAKESAAPRLPEPKTTPAPAAKPPVAKSVPSPAVRAPIAKGSTVAMLPRKPSPIPHPQPRVQRRAPAINASLLSRLPVPEKKLAPPPAPLSPVESFWCQMSTIDSNCNCKGAEERAANQSPMR